MYGKIQIKYQIQKFNLKAYRQVSLPHAKQVTF